MMTTVKHDLETSRDENDRDSETDKGKRAQMNLSEGDQFMDEK